MWQLLLLAASCTASGDTWALVACTSRYWFNYRHVANALSVYRVLKRLGLSDSRIILMLADDIPCNARNSMPGTVFKSVHHDLNLCAADAEIDFKGSEVTVDTFVRLLTGRHEPGWPASKRMHLTNESRVLIFMSGHGGDEFLKFQNHEEISSDDLSGILDDMKAAGRFSEMLFIVDTCQAGTLFNKLHTSGVITMGSSAKDENSYAHQNDGKVGVALVDRFTDAMCEFINRELMQLPRGQKLSNKVSLSKLVKSFNPHFLKSTPVVRSDLHPDPLSKVPVTRFFGHTDDVVLLSPSDRQPNEVAARVNDAGHDQSDVDGGGAPAQREGKQHIGDDVAEGRAEPFAFIRTDIMADDCQPWVSCGRVEVRTETAEGDKGWWDAFGAIAAILTVLALAWVIFIPEAAIEETDDDIHVSAKQR